MRLYRFSLVILGLAFLVAPVLATELGDDAPPVKVEKWLKGGPIDLKDGKGKTIYVVEFWATWCGPCRMSIPHLTELQKKVLPQNLWVETWGNRRRRFPQTPSWGFFPLTGLRRPARAKPALRMRAASRNPTKLGFALFPAAERLTGDADPRKVTHEFC